jgi:hypothetical protein
MISQLINYIKQQDFRFVFLALCLIFLPSFEAPKNLFAVLFVFSWALIARRDKDWGGNWRVIDTVFLLWILADIIVGINAIVVHGQPASGSKDIIKFVLVGWAVSRTGFTIRQMIHLCVIAIIFTVLPLGYSYLNCDGSTCIEFNSVGHVNHTAIYLLLTYVLSLSLLVFNFKNIGNLLRTILIVTTIILAYVVIDTHSRAASGLLAVVTLMAMAYSIYYYRNWHSLIISVLLLSFASVILVYNPPSILNKFINGSDLVGDSPRQKIRNFAYYLFKIDPVLGTGIGNFPNFNHDDIRDLVIEDVGSYDDSQFMPFKHPHNIYYVYLTGGGILLFSVFVWFWLQIVNIIYRVNIKSNEKWIVFSGISTVATVLGVGWVNTTLAHEHALIVMLVLGMLISLDRKTHAK